MKPNGKLYEDRFMIIWLRFLFIQGHSLDSKPRDAPDNMALNTQGMEDDHGQNPAGGDIKLLK